ncbi:C1 family peptidase [Saccharicrinis sp. GN24d3]|uniref:C1 family peptidase n=1 Tax=Saccharicrinis sp. GN24d3 TaxID=3458416 RepID=UPI004036999B
MRIIKVNILMVVACLLFSGIHAQDNFEFESIAETKTTAVKSQGSTGTCWAFSTVSFIESEIMRMGGPELDLSEMYIVKHTYEDKAQQYVLLHGMGNFSQGGQAHDVTNVIEEHGFVTESDFSGMPDTHMIHNHSEMATTLKTLLDAYIKQKGASPSEMWYKNIHSVLINYMGEVPSQVQFNKRTYSPVQFAQGFGIDKNNYVELSSYTHHPFYTPFDLEVPDNWSHDRYYNLPIDELINTMKSALEKGYSIVWDGDVSEDFFSHKKGVALVPEDESKGFVPQTEKSVTQEDRQKAFYSWKATDDHLMHIVGMAKDQNGTIYFKTKNSWGTKSNPYQGYLYMSEQYVRMNTVAVMLHKQALGKELSKKLFK